jgi:hypothetical protein
MSLSRHIRYEPALYSRYLVLEAQLLPFKSLHLELVNIDLFGEAAYGDIQVPVGLLHAGQFFQQDGSFLFVYIQTGSLNVIGMLHYYYSQAYYVASGGAIIIRATR